MVVCCVPYQHGAVAGRAVTANLIAHSGSLSAQLLMARLLCSHPLCLPRARPAGEQQRLGMARLFFHRPRFGVLDECTNATSVEVEEHLYKHAGR